MATKDKIETIRETTVRISAELRRADALDTPIDTVRLLDSVAMALFHVVGALEELDREVRRIAAERAYLRRHGWT